MISWSKVSRYVGKCNVIQTTYAFDKNWSFFLKGQYGSTRIVPDANLFKMVQIEKNINGLISNSTILILNSVSKILFLGKLGP